MQKTAKNREKVHKILTFAGKPLTIKLISDTIIVYDKLYKNNKIILANLPKDRDAKLSV